MRKATIARITLCFTLIAFSLQVSAQTKNQAIVGNWKGILNAGNQSLQQIIHIKQDMDMLSLTMDIPEQGATNLQCQDVLFRADSLFFNYKNAFFYKGKLTANDSITGTFMQNGFSFPLNFSRSDSLSDSVTTFIRPQTPKPPFPYVSRDVIYHTPDGKLQYGATITMPDTTGKYPAILLITGSGQQNRDEEIFGHKPFAVLADFLTRAGYLVMRVDDRGIGQSTGEFKKSTTLDFATDAENSLDYLKALPQADKQKLGLLGHSEGGIIAEMLAAKRSDLDFIILLAGPGINSFRLQELQRMAASKKLHGNIPPEALAIDSTIFHHTVKELIANNDSSLARKKAIESLNAYFAKYPSVFFQSDEQRAAIIQQNVAGFIKLIAGDIWTHQWLRLDASKYLDKIKCKVLALNGSEDFQVTPKENLAGIKAALAAGPCKDFEVKELPGLNHLFQRCKDCTLAEYSQLEQTLDPSLLITIKDWLTKNISGNK